MGELSKLMIVNHKAKKKQAVCDERVSYLQIALPWNWLTLKISSHESYHLVIKDSVRSNHIESVVPIMEEIGATNPKYVYQPLQV